jgi:hypothetical protein
MAVPNDRRVIFGVHVIPQEAILREDSTDAIYKLDATVAKRFGGKGSVDITSDQGTDYWTSMMSVGQDWALFDETWNGTASTWDTGAGEVSVNDSLSRIMPGSATTAVKFLYVKNLGSVECELALEGDERDILIPAGAAVAMRTTSTVTLATAKVATATSSGNTTTIEYIIAI